MKVLFFLKAPLAGVVKTRLAASIGPAAALEAYQTLLAVTAGSLASLPEVEVRFAPDDAIDAVKPWTLPEWRLHPQGVGDLGQRLERAFDEAFTGGAAAVAAVGSDCPYLRAADLISAQQLLTVHDVVVGPATDGGYWLIAANRFIPELFRGIDWSTDRVLTQTLAAVESLGLRVAQLRVLDDIDTLADWQAWLASRAAPLTAGVKPEASELRRDP